MPFRKLGCGGGCFSADEDRQEREDSDLEESEAGGEEGALSVFRILHEGE